MVVVTPAWTFIAQLNQMRRGDEDETPDEGEMSSENYGDEEFGDDVEDTAANDESDSESIANRQQRVRLMTITVQKVWRHLL